jgi:maltose/moltooligosaccharide transporter
MDQRTLGFSMQSFFIGIGAVVGSALPYMFTNWIGLSNTAPEGVIPDSVKWSFYIGAFVFLAAVLWTVFRSFEYSPQEMEEFEEEEVEGHTEVVFDFKSKRNLEELDCSCLDLEPY